jgi:hypothetical protein
MLPELHRRAVGPSGPCRTTDPPQALTVASEGFLYTACAVVLDLGVPFLSGLVQRREVVLGEAISYSLNGTSVPALFIRHVFPQSIEMDTKPNVHFDGPKMDRKGLWLPEKDLTLARAPLKFIQLARRGRAQT